MAQVARKDDYHTCPMTTGTTPHVGGAILSGSGTVKVEGKKAARWMDKAKCNGPVDAIIGKVKTKVLINFRPTAVMGSTTVHGGKVVMGAMRVSIG